MYKKTGQSHHYLPRKGSYSTVPHRNGRVDVLPPESSEALYDITKQINDARARLDQIKIKRECLVTKSLSLRKIEQLREKLSGSSDALNGRRDIELQINSIDREAAELKKHIGSLTALLGGVGVHTFEEAFERVAKAELSTDVYDMLARKARLVLQAARPEKRR